MNKEKIIEWCWENLAFTNCPENWEDTCIVDILNFYQGNCRKHDGTVLTYSKIRSMFKNNDY